MADEQKPVEEVAQEPDADQTPIESIEPSEDPASEFPEVLPDPDFQELVEYVPPAPYKHTSERHAWMVTQLEDGRFSCKPWSFNGEARIVAALKDLP